MRDSLFPLPVHACKHARFCRLKSILWSLCSCPGSGKRKLKEAFGCFAARSVLPVSINFKKGERIEDQSVAVLFSAK